MLKNHNPEIYIKSIYLLTKDAEDNYDQYFSCQKIYFINSLFKQFEEDEFILIQDLIIGLEYANRIREYINSKFIKTK